MRRSAETVVWGIHGACFGPPLAAPGHHKVVPLEDPRATVRYFVRSDKLTRLHRFARGESHALNLEAMVRQLAGAEYVARGPKTPPVLGPR